jgi:hypothetical protein
MAARLETETGANPVEPLQEVLAAFGHVGALQQRRPTGDKTDRIAGRMAIDTEKGVAQESLQTNKGGPRYREPPSERKWSLA